MTRNKKLRLLVTKKCHNDCPKCCNKQYDLDAVPVIDRFDYDEVCITGGEPMLDFQKVIRIAEMFKTVATVLGKEVKVYLYTARITSAQLHVMMTRELIDGICVTPHSNGDINDFKKLNRGLLFNFHIDNSFYEDISLRLNLFADVKEHLRDENLILWKIKEMEWLDECPVPEGEDFRRVAFRKVTYL